MGRWCSRRILALLFGLLLAVGTVVPAVQASDMAPDLATMNCVDATGAICCGDCGGADGDVNADPCLPVCTAGASAVIPAPTILSAADQPQMLAPIQPASRDRASSPDPDPPRTIDLV